MQHKEYSVSQFEPRQKFYHYFLQIVLITAMILFVLLLIKEGFPVP